MAADANLKILAGQRICRHGFDSMHQRLSGAQPGLVGYWRFDDGTGQAAHDASIHASDGILGQLPLPDVADPTWTTNAAPTP